MSKIKWYIFVFFARIRTKRRIKKLNKELESLSWFLVDEWSDTPQLIERYNKVREMLFINETALKGLNCR